MPVWTREQATPIASVPTGIAAAGTVMATLVAKAAAEAAWPEGNDGEIGTRWARRPRGTGAATSGRAPPSSRARSARTAPGPAAPLPGPVSGSGGSRPAAGPRVGFIGAALPPGDWPAVLVPCGSELALSDPAEQAAQPHEPRHLLDAPLGGRGDAQRPAARGGGLGLRRPPGGWPGRREQHAQRPGVDLELDRGVEHDRLAVDADLQLAARRVDLEASGGPARPALPGLVAAAEQVLERAADLLPFGPAQRRHLQHARVQARPTAELGQRVGVVADEQDQHLVPGHPGAVAEGRPDRQGVALEHALEDAVDRAQPVVAVARLVHQRGIDADGGVVEEQPPADRGDVHASLGARHERLDR